MFLLNIFRRKIPDFDSLGPFVVTTIYDKLDNHGKPLQEIAVNEGTRQYVVTRLLDKPLANPVAGPLSPINAINLDDQGKADALIPRDAAFFAWAYPADGRVHRLPASDRKRHAGVLFLHVGGFVYLDQEKQVLRVNGVQVGLSMAGTGLAFDAPVDLPPEAELLLQFVEVTVDELRQAGATHFAWMPPFLDDKIRLPVPVPFGGFAYKFTATEKDRNPVPRYFPVRSGAPTRGNVRPVAAVKQLPLANLTPIFEEYLGLLTVAGLRCATDLAPIGPRDALVVVNMQEDFLPSGAMPVSEANAIVGTVVGLIRHAQQQRATIVASRAYFPEDHVSFLDRGGQLEPHCIQGSAGSFFIPAVAEALFAARHADPRSTHVAFRGFHEEIESDSVYPYDDPADPDARKYNGGVVLACSNIEQSINAPPDVRAIEFYEKESKYSPSVAQVLDGVQRVFVCGLGFDLTVLQTAAAARRDHDKVFIVVDATRPLYKPGIGHCGTGFVTDPACVRTTLEAGTGITLVPAALCVRKDTA